MFTGIITGVGRIAAVHDLGSSLQPRQAPHHRGAGRLPRRRRPGRQHRAQRRLHDGHRARRRPAPASPSTSRPNRWTRPPAWPSPAPSTSKKPCARTTAWAATSSPATWTASARVTPLRAGRRKLGAAHPGAARRWRKYLAYKGSITVNGVSLTVNRVADSADGCEVSINLIPHTVQNTALGTLARRQPRQPRDRPDRPLRRAHARRRRPCTTRHPHDALQPPRPSPSPRSRTSSPTCAPAAS